MADTPEKIPPHPAHDAAYPDHSAFPALPDHFSVVSAQASGGTHDSSAHDSLGEDLKQAGFEPQSLQGHSGQDEQVYLIPHSGSEKHQKAVEEIAWKYNQDHVIHSSKEKNRLVARDGSESSGDGITHGPHIKDHYLKAVTGHHFQLNLGGEEIKKSDAFGSLTRHKKKRADHSKPWHYGVIAGMNLFHAMHESHDQLPGVHVKNPDDKQLEQAIDQAEEKKEPAVVVHGNPPPLLRENAPPGESPHSYDWHCSSAGPDLGKADTSHLETWDAGVAKTHHPGDSQYAGEQPVTYRPIAESYGELFPGHPSNLHFYGGIESLEDKIDSLIQEKGYKTYFAGGKHGAPDIANKNYGQNWLMIWDPAEAGNDDPYIRAWRKLHELAHALTLPEVDQIYGPGKRVGKIGELSPREAKRAIHWEWLSGQKQRELAQKIGHEISDEDFAREMNTLMHDSVHRVVTGMFAEPSDEGFRPHSELVPFESAVKQVEDHAKRAGLDHDEATFQSTGVPKDVMRDYEIIHKSEGLSGELKEGGKIKKFYLWREDDESGVSGTGRVAEGVVFSNGWVGMNWLTKWGSVGFYPSVHDLLSIHGHGDKTKVVWEKEDEDPKVVHKPGQPIDQAASKLEPPKQDQEDVKKAFTQGDGETLTDPKSHDAAASSVPEWLMNWGSTNLVPMAKDGHAEFELAGKKIKIRKVLEDLYSGWIEHANHIIHQFEKLTLPLVLSQLQSKLELYGKEEMPVAPSEEPKLGEVTDSPASEAKEEKQFDNIAAKIKELQAQVEVMRQAEIKEHLSGKELASGIENPEQECAACERASEKCVCYMNLPTPRIEVTPKGVNIFFKSEWGEEDISNFKQDLIRRAGTVLEQRRIMKAREALQKLKGSE